MKKSSILILWVAAITATQAGASELTKEIDATYARGGIAAHRKCLELCEKGLKANPQDFEILWRCARAHRWYGEEAKRAVRANWKGLCKKHGKEGMNQAQKAMGLKPDRPEGHYYYGLSVGIYADSVSMFTALKEGLKDKAQNSLERVYKVDKMYDRGGAILALGRFWYVLPWPMTNKKKALAYYREFQKTPCFKESMEAHVYLGELLVEKRQTRKEGRALLQVAAKSDTKFYADMAKRLLK